MQSQTKAYLYGISAVLLWSTVATAFKIALRYLEPIQLLLFASITSTLVLAAVITVQRKWHLLVQACGQSWRFFLGMGLLNPLFYYLVLFQAYDLLPAQQAQSLNYTWAITLTLLSVPILGHSIRRNDWIAIMLGYLGVLVISTQGKLLAMEFTSGLGVLLALLSTLIWALYWIFNTKNTQDPVLSLFAAFLFSLPFILFVTAYFSSVWVTDIKALAAAAYVGLFEMGVTFVLWLMALKHTESTARISNLIFISPFLSLFFISTFIGEEIVPATYIGLVLIVSGLLIQQAGSRSVELQQST